MNLKPNLLITGASGFIGSHLIEEAISQGFKVFAAVRKSSKVIIPTGSNVTILYFQYDYAELIDNLTNLKKQYGRFEYIIYNAGITRAINESDYNDVNSVLPKKLLQSLKLADNIPDKFILVCSMAAFGPGDNNSLAPITIAQERKPISNYGKSKKVVSDFFLAQTTAPCIIVYPTAVYGPRDKDFINFVKLINKGIEPYIGFHKQLISMIHVKDLSYAVVGLLKKGNPGSEYIISDNRNYDKKELGTIIKTILNKKTLRLIIPLKPVLWISGCIEFVYKCLAPNKLPLLKKEKINEISCANWSCDSADVWNTLGKQPEFDLKSGMEQTIGWYRSNGKL